VDENPMLQVPVRTREIPSPTLSTPSPSLSPAPPQSQSQLQPQQLQQQIQVTSPQQMQQMVPIPQPVIVSPQIPTRPLDPPQTLNISSSPIHNPIFQSHQNTQPIQLSPLHSQSPHIVPSNILLDSPMQNYPMFIPTKLSENSPLINHPGKLINLSGFSTPTQENLVERKEEIQPESTTNVENNSVPENDTNQNSTEENENLDQFEQHSESESIELIIQSDSVVNNCSGNDYRFIGNSPVTQAEVKVPESHLMHLNAYPGTGNHQVPIDIVKSFAPVVSPQKVQQPPPTTEVADDIYNDYKQDPYNLTLQIETNSNSNNVKDASTVFQSASYFGNDSSDFLFNRP
jgi:hypothetical protein